MIPYYPEPAVHIGALTIQAFRILLTAGVVLGGFVMVKRASRLKLGGERMFEVSQYAIVFGLAGAHVAKMAMDYHPLLAADPALLFTDARGLRSIGGLAGGLIGALICCLWHRRLSIFQTFQLLDVMAFATPFGFAVGRLGCALAHDHRGLATASWVAVRFPDGPRYDLGLLECLFLAGLSALFYLLDRKPRAAGFFLGLYGMLYGSFRIWLDTLHLQPMRFYEGCALLLMGMAAWVAAHPALKPAESPLHFKTVARIT